jgi:hypothetical protein
MARRAELIGVEVESNEDVWSFRGAYRPYYDRGLTHERSVVRKANGDWVITDVASGGSPTRAQSFIHLHPRVSAKTSEQVSAKAPDDESLAVECASGSLLVRIEPFGADGVSVIEASERPDKAEQSWYFPDFGVACPARTICFNFNVKKGKAFGYRIIRR